ncbi:AAA family ATPase [Rothia aeria]|uniref:AAA family ATPase n=1 Tax=Rothia aeria TaxID=172042 RepID=UPI00241D55AA|nr:AAA family ATPase [Rothia aeria]
MVDATKVSKIKIDTGYAGVKEYPIFTRVNSKGQILEDAQCVIILGKNSSGKSTIARALDDGSNVEFFNKEGVLLGGNCDNVYVFDEWFIGENFRMSDEETLKLIFEIRKLKSWQETISSIVKLPYSGGITDEIRELVRNLAKQLAPMQQIANQILENQINFNYRSEVFSGVLRNAQMINHSKMNENRTSEGSDEAHKNFEEPQGSELSHKKEGFEESVAEEESEESAVGSISEDIHEDSTEDDMSNQDEWEDAWDKLSPEEQQRMKNQLAEISKITQRVGERFSGQFLRGFQVPRIEVPRIEVPRIEVPRIELPRIVNNPRKASDNINTFSSIVFGESLISVKCVEGGYEIFKGKEKVVPSSLSTGEQNVLSLCYFFAQMMDGQEYGSIERFLTGNQIIILDDPLSSFDFGNKYGVIRLLDYVMNLMSKSESKSKLIIMTHDPETAIELSKIAIGRLGGEKVKCCEISNNDENMPLKSVKFDGIDEYKNILGKMYGIAVGKEGAEMPAPNEVRRVWEAFLRFELGVSSVSDRKAIEKIRDYYDAESVEYEFLDSFMSYTFIHQDSHSASQMLFFNFFLSPVLSDEDFRKHIRQIICFIHIVSPLHIASRLSNNAAEVGEHREKLKSVYEQVVLKETSAG